MILKNSTVMKKKRRMILKKKRGLIRFSSHSAQNMVASIAREVPPPCYCPLVLSFCRTHAIYVACSIAHSRQGRSIKSIQNEALGNVADGLVMHSDVLALAGLGSHGRYPGNAE